MPRIPSAPPWSAGKSPPTVITAELVECDGLRAENARLHRQLAVFRNAREALILIALTAIAALFLGLAWEYWTWTL